MTMFEGIIQVLEKSVEKHGEVPLTNRYLLNILKLVKRHLEELDYQSLMEDGVSDVMDAGDR